MGAKKNLCERKDLKGPQTKIRYCSVDLCKFCPGAVGSEITGVKSYCKRDIFDEW